MQLLIDEMTATKELLTEMATLSADAELPLPFKRLINDTFKCCICHSVPMKPPVIIARCCKNMLAQQKSSQIQTNTEFCLDIKTEPSTL